MAALPLNRHLVHTSTWSNPKSRAWDLVDAHPLNQQVDVFLPSATPGSVGPLAREGSFFYAMRVSPLALLQECLAKPELRYYATLKNAPIDGANTLGLFPSGHLVLVLDHATYTQFGLIGEKVATASGEALHGRRYRVVIELHAKNMVDAASAFRARVLACVARFPPLDLLLCAINSRGSFQTIAITDANVDDDESVRKRIEVTSQVQAFADIALPAHVSSTTDRDEIAAVYEWLGLVACRLLSPLPDEYLSSYASPIAETTPGRAVSLRWRGLIPDTLVHTAVEYAKKQVADGSAPFAAVSVWGFPDSVASWWQKGHRRDHGFQLEGANGYTILCLPHDTYCIIQSLGAQDRTV
ncbi:hypothetical protein SPRG_14075 [Saprolegnia parasitica CBS 223.65]|uniref:Uncharacterized protein n=1 Tax=Saprolegnia parasitica (strain CBS 223.65) TaxID=695850 RepID=A0A067BQR7_SAPPC|nr:hypothetical protein SPRG_14075 [Saprolegnia parasitica CBS 223.65]KDO20844.1 hypothetical protein SPRG_14075 [Saprolegnia parasitica CBS 223.65]|eukprot:XP_012208422.1 hypothetical protein SPRG_14075 [Saprolegnia parasitica CBS 223.65]